LNSDVQPVSCFIEPEHSRPAQVYLRPQGSTDEDHVHVLWFLDELVPDGRVRRHEHRARYHLWTSQTLRMALEAHGFSSPRFFGDYDRGRMMPARRA
jgi:hypothetical protein